MFSTWVISNDVKLALKTSMIEAANFNVATNHVALPRIIFMKKMF